jgi:AraC family transcriptional regulator
MDKSSSSGPCASPPLIHRIERRAMAKEGIGASPELRASLLREWAHRVMSLLDAAIGELDNEAHPAKCTVLQAASLLREQIDLQAAAAAADDAGRLLAWQARKVREYIDGHIADPIRVTDLCALIQRSEAHFSRAFKRTFGVSPHAFVVQRRLELATHYMVETDRCLSDIALGCGFTDQAHLCKHFRQAMGETPASWRRARRSRDFGDGALSLSSQRTAREVSPIYRPAALPA